MMSGKSHKRAFARHAAIDDPVTNCFAEIATSEARAAITDWPVTRLNPMFSAGASPSVLKKISICF
jgi:hypothetical protein